MCETHGPLSGTEVLQGPCCSLQSVVVLALSEQRQVQPHYLWLVQQLKTCRDTERERETERESERERDMEVRHRATQGTVDTHGGREATETDY
jgi:hypothetical protein